MLQEIRLVRRVGLTQLWMSLLWLLALLFILLAPGRFAAAATAPTVMFVTQPPFGADFATVNAVFGNHRGDTRSGPRGGDLYIRYGDGTLRNLTADAGYGSSTGQEIAVREPTVHWSGSKAIFSMVVGGTIRNDYAPVYWQIYEVTGLGSSDTVQITKLPQPADSNNVSPLYGTDDRILFTADRPRNADRMTYPQLDEYESTPTVTGIWSMNPDGSDLRLLDHAVSGDFTPTIASDGRIVFTRWDHLQRDQQNNEGTLSYGAFNYASEASSQALSTNAEIFPELRRQPAGSFIHGHTFNFFFPWQVNEDGTGLETLNHLGRHELARYFDSAHDGLPEFIAPQNRRTADLLLQLREDPTRPGYFYCTKTPEFGTHASGQIIGIFAPESINADAMQVDYVTDPISESVVGDAETPPANHPGHFRNPVALSDGSLIAVHTTSPFADRPTAGALSSRYDFHLVQLDPSLSYRTVGARLVPNGISKTISYWDNYSYSQHSYSGPLWELDPVEVRARPRPPRHTDPLPQIETQILTQELGGQAGIDRLRVFLEGRNLALVVSRNVTRRADKQQDFNLRIAGTSTQTAQPGATPLDIAFMQFLQGDLIRGYSSFTGGRRVLGQLMHDGLLADTPGAPPSSVVLADDGSMAAFVPARRALTWQMLAPDGSPALRERYWLTFAPGEMRVCTNCHGINTTDVVLQQPAPTNPPLALRQLAQWWRASFDDGGSGSATPTATPTFTPVSANTAPPTAPPTASRTATRTPSRTATASPVPPATSTPPSVATATFTAVATATAPASGTGATYYVALTGNDANAGTNAAPWRTLQKAGDVAAAGDTVIVLAGSYQGFRPRQPGTAQAPVRFLAQPGVIVTSPGASNSNGDNIWIRNVDYVVIDGFESTNAPRSGIAIQGEPDANVSGVVIRNCHCHHNSRWGIFTGFARDLVLEDNETSFSAIEHGIYVSNSGDRPIVRRNHAHDNNASGIQLNADPSQQGDDPNDPQGDGIIEDALIEANIIHGNGVAGGAAINLASVRRALIRNNLLYANRATGIAGWDDGFSSAYGSRDNGIIGNTIVQPSNGRFAIGLLNGSINNVVIDNILLHAGTRGSLEVDPSSQVGLVSDYNVVVNVFSDDSTFMNLSQWRQRGFDQNSILSSSAALFVNAGANDYHLSATSPARDTGVVRADLPNDLENRTRPQGTRVDIGALELAVSGPAPTQTATTTATPSTAVPPTSTRSATATTTRSATPSATPSRTWTSTVRPSFTPTHTPSPTLTRTRTLVPSATRTLTRTPTRTVAGTFTPTRTVTRSPTRSPSPLPASPTATRVSAPPATGRILWLDASQIVGLTEGTGVGSWLDGSGTAHHATQGTLSLRPTYRATGVNGRPSVRFDGVDDHLRIASPLLVGSTARTVAFVARATVVGNRGIIDLGDGRTTGGAFMITPEYGVRVSGGNRLFQRSASAAAEIGVITLPGTTTDSITAVINAVAVAPASTGSLVINTAGLATLGSFTAEPINKHNFAGDIAEILVYNRALTPTEVDTLQRYLAAKYSIALP